MHRRVLAVLFLAYNLLLASALASLTPGPARTIYLDNADFGAPYLWGRESTPFHAGRGESITAHVAVYAISPASGSIVAGTVAILRTGGFGIPSPEWPVEDYVVLETGDYVLVASPPGSCGTCTVVASGIVVVTGPNVIGLLPIPLAAIGIGILATFPLWYVQIPRPSRNGPVTEALERLGEAREQDRGGDDGPPDR